MVHSIVDSLWLKKPDAGMEEYGKLCEEMGQETGLPVSFEGLYKWVVFLNSKVDPRVPVLNRYYGILQDGTMKVRGIELRRHDTPGIVRKCQEAMLGVLARAGNSHQFRALIPGALKILKKQEMLVRNGSALLDDLVIVKNLSKDPSEYTHQVPQAIAARQLVKEGGRVHAGQRVSYIHTQKKLGESSNSAVPVELVDENAQYDPEKYVDLLYSSAANILLPFGYDLETLRRQLR